jgi:hypothetical protein
LRAGVEFAQTGDAAQCLLKIVGDDTINGHSFFISFLKCAPHGYMNLEWKEFPNSALICEIQEDQMKSASVDLGLFV